MALDSNEYKKICRNSKEATKGYDFRVLTYKLIEAIERISL